MSQRWHSLLFAHWPIAAEEIAPLLPPGLVVDGFAGTGWVGIVPFAMDRIRFRGLGSVPGARRFAELNLRTYVREERTGNARRIFLFSGRGESSGGDGGAILVSPAVLLGEDACRGTAEWLAAL